MLTEKKRPSRLYKLDDKKLVFYDNNDEKKTIKGINNIIKYIKNPNNKILTFEPYGNIYYNYGTWYSTNDLINSLQNVLKNRIKKRMIKSNNQKKLWKDDIDEIDKKLKKDKLFRLFREQQPYLSNIMPPEYLNTQFLMQNLTNDQIRNDQIGKDLWLIERNRKPAIIQSSAFNFSPLKKKEWKFLSNDWNMFSIPPNEKLKKKEIKYLSQPISKPISKLLKKD